MIEFPSKHSLTRPVCLPLFSFLNHFSNICTKVITISADIKWRLQMGTCVPNRSPPIRRINENDRRVLLGWTTEDSEDIDLDKMIWGCLSLGKLAEKAGKEKESEGQDEVGRSVLMRNYENHTFSIKEGDIFNYHPVWQDFANVDLAGYPAAKMQEWSAARGIKRVPMSEAQLLEAYTVCAKSRVDEITEAPMLIWNPSCPAPQLDRGQHRRAAPMAITQDVDGKPMEPETWLARS
ncbi:hypothetical protein PV11_10055 [Exophiala sideris]|uniref:Uncharacterized protein n=1 Tax=Exophiala sideris TaxID=1016849 RepID=A0A0D1YBV8_9EURO|nr:hypothetical protein PV11_10055 [Exophiala sideris]